MIKVCKVCGKEFIAKGAKKYCSKECALSVKYYKTKNQNKETLCWECKNACGKCSWSKNFVPVKGWEALPTKIKGSFESETVIDSFLVINCPEFIRG